MNGPLDTGASPSFPCILVYAPRERAKSFARAAFPKRKARVIVVKTAQEFSQAIRRDLIDAALVDLANGAGVNGAGTNGGDDTWAVATSAQDFPSVPYFGLTQSRTTDGPAIARAVQLGFADVLAEPVDEEAARELILPMTFSSRFSDALHEPPPPLGLTTPIQRKTWQEIVRHAGRPVTTRSLAAEVGVSREHLSRNFAQGRGPNLKRVIDFVRLVAAAELSKNPGYDVRDVAAVLGFASSSHLAVTAQRIASTRPASLAGLRTVDLVDRFTQGRTRSRVAGNGGL